MILQLITVDETVSVEPWLLPNGTQHIDAPNIQPGLVRATGMGFVARLQQT
jgi:hypothetical protein